MRRFTGLRSRLLFTALPLVLAMTATLGAILVTQARGIYLAGVEEQLLGQARLAAATLAPRWDDRDALGAAPGQFARETGNRLVIVAPDGALLGDSHGAAGDWTEGPDPRAALAGGAASGTREVGGDGTVAYAVAPILHDGRALGAVRVERRVDPGAAGLDRLRTVALLGVASSAALTAGLAVLLARSILRRIDALNRHAVALAAGHFDRRDDPRSTDEIDRLGRTFDRMADELQQTIGLISDERGKLAAVLETMDDGVLMIDGGGTTALANAAAARLLDPPGGGDPRGRPFVEVTRNHELSALVERARRGGRPETALIEFGRPRRALRVVATPVPGVGEASILVVLHDLTELRRLETARRDFVANISHELRTPLATIKALVETLEGGSIEDEADSRHFLHLVGQEVDHLTELVRELLELSRIESGQVPLRREAVAPAALILPAVERLRAQAERAGLRLDVGPLDGLPAPLADPQRIGQVLLNLVHNAIKFTPPGGTITVGAERRGSLLAITVRDTGGGIDPDDLPRIFERFYKADKARSGGGTGLGLAIAKHTVNAHGGVLTAANNRGGGAAFTFTLPLAPQATLAMSGQEALGD